MYTRKYVLKQEYPEMYDFVLDKNIQKCMILKEKKTLVL